MGISPKDYAIFSIAAGHGYAKNAPADFVKRFDDTASQKILNIINRVDKNYSEIRDKKVEEAFNKFGKYSARVPVAQANMEYDEKMAKVRAYADKLRKIQNKFFS